MSSVPATRRGRRLGTAARLSGSLAILLAVVLGVSTWATWVSFSRRTMSQATAQITASLKDVSRSLRVRGAADYNAWALSYLSITALPAGEHVLLAVPGGARYGSQGSNSLLRAPAVAHLLRQPPASTTTSTVTTPSGGVLLLASPMREQGRAVGSVVVAYDLNSLEQDQERVLVLVSVEAVIALLVAVAGTYLLLRRLLGTIGTITSTARTISEGDLDLRLGDQGSDDEVGELAATFDDMLDRIDEVMEVQRRLLSDVSHQLKTPLTVMRGHIEVLRMTGVDDAAEVDRTLGTVLSEIEHLRVLTEDLLFLGRSLEPGFLELVPIDLRLFLADVVSATSVLAARQVSLGAVPDVVIEIDETKMRGALLNLVDTAVKATVDGDRIEVSASLRHPGGELVLTVGDSGPGVPANGRARVLERFGRPRSEIREGSGLGLAIVGTVAESHGGHVELGDAPLGGLAASIVLPATAVLDVLPIGEE